MSRPSPAIVKALVVKHKNSLMEQKQSITTVNRKLTLLGHYLRWCKANDHVTTVATEGVKLSLRAQKAGAMVRQAFSPAQLHTILSSQRLAERRNDPHGVEHYWVTVMTIYTGCRVGEIAQLCGQHVKAERGIDFIDLSKDLQLKNASSIRKVVLHSELLKLGILDYVAVRRKRSGPDAPLFPTLAKDNNSTVITGFFRRLMRSIGMSQKDLSLHSARHYWATAMVEAGVPSELRHYILGHALPRSVQNVFTWRTRSNRSERPWKR